ncbi:hypothetical protein ACTRXD_00420 [Nitrospira sp. T9]|uniref:hypothetical protein n=1 Tax=unclassified Nitrospira TaxID=2652172 RepID=UPI003F9C6CDB
MSILNLQWEQSSNGKDGHEALFLVNEQGQKFQMAQIFPSNSQNREMGFTMVKRDMNYGLGDRFIPQNDKTWNMAYQACKEKSQVFAQSQIEMAHQLTGDRSHVHEMVGQGANGRTPEPELDHGHDR